MASLLEISILSHYHVFRRDYDGISAGSPAHNLAVKKLLKLGLLEMNENPWGIFSLTDLGNQYIEVLKGIPFTRKVC